MKVDKDLLETSLDVTHSPDKHVTFRASASSVQSSENDSVSAKSNAGNSFGRFAHKANSQRNEPGSAVVKSMHTCPVGEYETYPPMWQWQQDGRPDMSHMHVSSVPEEGDIFVKSPLSVKGNFLEGT